MNIFNSFLQLFFFTGFLLGCGGLQSKSIIEGGVKSVEVKQVKEKEYNPYQLGDFWDRKPTKANHLNHKSLFRVKFFSDGLKSSNVSLLKIKGQKALLLFTRHSLKESCFEEYLELLSAHHQYEVYCKEMYHIIPETDLVIVEVLFLNGQDISGLKPVGFASDYKEQDILRFYSIDKDSLIKGYYPLASDNSVDCRLLSINEQYIQDPDKLNTLPYRSWSLPVSCDVQHGDSGGILVNDYNELVGVLWTGSYPKKKHLTSEYLKRYKDIENMWADFNYIVPGNRIKEALDQVLVNSEI